jgi:hypothetical protein
MHFSGMPRGSDPRGFFDDYEMVINKADDDALLLPRWRRGVLAHLDDVTLVQPTGGIAAQFAADVDPARFDPTTDLGP